MAAGSTGECTFELPSKVFNLAQSVPELDAHGRRPGRGRLCIEDVQNTVPELYQIQLYSRNGVFLVDMQNANVWVRAPWHRARRSWTRSFRATART